MVYRNVIYLKSRRAYSAPVIRAAHALNWMIVLPYHKAGGQIFNLKGLEAFIKAARLPEYVKRL